jgi:hypothetical protein
MDLACVTHDALKHGTEDVVLGQTDDVKRDRDVHHQHEEILAHGLLRDLHDDWTTDPIPLQGYGERDLEDDVKADLQSSVVEHMDWAKEHIEDAPDMSLAFEAQTADYHCHLDLDCKLERQLCNDMTLDDETEAVEFDAQDLEQMLKDDNTALASEYWHSTEDDFLVRFPSQSSSTQEVENVCGQVSCCAASAENNPDSAMIIATFALFSFVLSAAPMYILISDVGG